MALDPIQQSILNSANIAPVAQAAASPWYGNVSPGLPYGPTPPPPTTPMFGAPAGPTTPMTSLPSSVPSALATPGTTAAASPADQILAQGYKAGSGGAGGLAGEAEALLPEAAGGAAALGKWGNIVNKLPFGNAESAALGPAIGVGIGGQVLGGLIDSANIGGQNSNWDKGLTGGIKGLGLGGAGALALGLTGPVGWSIAGGAALIGAISGIAGGDHQSDADHLRTTYDNVLGNDQKQGVLDKLGDTYGLNATDLNNVKLGVQATMDLLRQNGDRKGMDAYVSNLAQTLPQQLLQYKQARDADNQHFARVAAMQAQFAPMFNSIAGQSTAANAVAYQNSVQAADQLQATNPQLASLIKANAGQSQSSSDAMLAAYASQIAIGSANAAGSNATPTAQQITQQQQSQAQLAALQQAMAQPAFTG